MIFTKLEPRHIPEIKTWMEHDRVRKWVYIDDWDAYYEYANNNGATFLFAVYDNDAFIGELTAEKEDDCLHIALIINPRHQNRGYGAKALNYFAENVRTLTGCTPKYLHAGIFTENTASVKCFSKAGYISHGTDTDGDERWLLRLR